MRKGVVYLIPTYLDEANDRSFLAPMAIDVIQHTTCFLVENIRSARRFISSLSLGIQIENLHFHELNKDTHASELGVLFKPVFEGKNVGIMSEAGLPGLADPGGLAVRFAHQHDISVVPLPGASAIQTALISSGFNGQQFVFHGYVPIPKPERLEFIKKMEQQCSKTGYTQLFMETPFRNQSLMQDILATCQEKTLLSVAAGVFSPSEYIKTMFIAKWKSTAFDFHKIPAVFSFGI